MEGRVGAFILKNGRQLPFVALARPDRAAVPEPGARMEFVVGAGTDCDLVIDEPGWQARHLEFVWRPKHSSWVLGNVSDAAVVADGRILQPQSELPLLMWESVIEGPGVQLQFRRQPDPPRYLGAIAREVPLAGGLVIGRGEKNKDGSPTPRLALDPDLLSIATMQAEIRQTGADYILFNLNPRGRTILNGDQSFDQKKLILGDCVQIPNCEQYTFKFTGTALKVLPPSGALSARGLVVDVPRGRILHEVNMDVRRGDFVGIIGGSGQGKSTLMNSICGIVPPTQGGVSADGFLLRSPRDVATANIGYVPQDDIVHTELTVESALYFAARLRLKASRQQIADLIESTLETLRLTEHRQKKISALSGGQRKRVSIASELLVSPDYLFLDEPTSGLDPQTEQALMGELSTLANRRRIGVVSTTHVLQNCHVMSQLAFISRGRLIFFGSPVETVRFFVYGRHAVDGAGSRSGTSSTFNDGESGHGSGGFDEDTEFSESDLLVRIANIYDIAQDPTKPIPVQDKMAADWEARYRQIREKALPPPPPPPPVPGGPPAPPKVSTLLSLWLLLRRQWKLLTASKLNYLFLILQATVIGLLIAWVSDNIVLQLFLSLIATLWFGCSNGAQQIVSELQIFRRERLAGLGIHTYLCSKFAFLTAITTAQGLLLFALVNFGTLWLQRDHSPDPERTEDQQRQAEIAKEGRMPRMAMPDKETRQFRIDFFSAGNWNGVASKEKDEAADSFSIIDSDPTSGPPPKQTVELNPTGLVATSREYLLLENVAWLFRMRENVMESLGVRKVDVKPGETAEEVQRRNIQISWVHFVLNVIGLRLLALTAAAVVGVGLGMAVSSLVNTPTQAVMWVPLILIPQILFGSFVVIVPDMTTSVLRFSSLLPSFNLQRTMDVALIYGRAVPRMTNKTKVPTFLSNPPKTKETVEWGDHEQTEYDRVSEVNKSWQNLVVDRLRLGAREKKPEGEDSVQERDDVRIGSYRLTRGNHFLDISAVNRSLGMLALWVAVCYGVAAVSLYRRQTGR